ncbi:MAG: aminotransferase class III-fold pyridoxal phosphate-dependent enzyme [Leptospiraceae bacterium]|nr:aminotransferase class III-fold pyridoxal phosphate-dependent enzyme [Leptospiraceae bacterium]
MSTTKQKRTPSSTSSRGSTGSPGARRSGRSNRSGSRVATHGSQQQYSISEWHNTDEIYDRLKALLKEPPRTIRRDRMNEVMDYFDNRCQRSKAIAEEAQKYIPGGVQHNLAFNYPFPLVVDRARGAYLRDVDGNKYIDFLQAGGPTLLGSNYEPVQKKIIKLIQDCGPVTGLLHEYEALLAKEIHRHMPGIEMFRMLGSGTESVMAAIRLARAYTGKKKIIKIGGGYHGWSDPMVYGMRIPGTGRREAAGIPRGATSQTQECFPNDIGALRRKMMLNRLRGGTAAVIVEPLGPESGTRPVYANYNAELRKLCDEFGALLIFDEVVTGFRLGLGGAQGYFKVQPDLTVFGKCLTGGYPMAGGVGGRKEVMMLLAGGISAMGKRAFVGGTLSANPLSCAAGYFSIQEMEKHNAAVKAGRAGDRLAAGLKEIVNRLNLPYVVYNQGSIVHLQTSAVLLMSMRNPIKVLKEAKERKHMMEEMGAAFMANGIVTLAGSRIYTSMADTDAIIDEALNRFETVLKMV